jgi:isoquinoline 1-oxidoreductase beta subunit
MCDRDPKPEGIVGTTELSRRKFVGASMSAGGGLALAVGLPSSASALPMSTEPWTAEIPESHEMSAWIVIDPDETITVRLPHAEMGQGAATALPMFVAEELECDWTKVKGEFASANRNHHEEQIYGGMVTTGSRGLISSREDLQQAGASARVRLVAAAANRWSVPILQCAAANGVVTHAPTGRSLSFGSLAADAANIAIEIEPAIKTPDQYKLVGQSVARLDTPVKVDGTAKFGIDTRLENMVYAAVMDCPVFGGTLVSVDESSILGRRGIIRVVKMPSAVAVVADNYWRAEQALRMLNPIWDGGEAAGSNSEQIRQLYLDALEGPMAEVQNDGDAPAALEASENIVDVTYEAPLLAHATMEPLNATVLLSDDRLDVWMGSQAPYRNLLTAAEVSGLRPEQVFVHNTYLGGGFGRRSRNDEMVHAILVAKEMDGRPVKMVWSREQEIRHDRYRPQAAVRMRGAVADGKITAADIKISCGSISRSLNGPQAAPNGIENQAIDGFDDCPYAIPNHRIGLMLKNTHVPVAFWRSVGGSQNVFFFESFIDELAHEAGVDPLAFRRSMTTRRDFLGVIDTLEEHSNWSQALPAGRGRGISICENHRAVTGHVAEVTVDNAGNVRVDRVVAAVDCYHVANPKLVEAQLESGIIYGLTAALYGEITIENGAVTQGNFDSYPMVTMRDAPDIEVYLSLSGGENWAGVGECATAPIAAAVTNAIFAATGKRVRQLPLKNINLRELAQL